MSNPPYFVTGDAEFSASFAIAIRFPKSQQNWIYSAFLAALYNLGQVDAWLTGGETTPEEAAEIFQDIFNNGIEGVYFDIGDLKWSAGIPSASWILCDGRLINQADWPDLYTAIGTTFNHGGEPPGTFRVPDLQGRTLAGVDPGNIRLPFGWATAIGGAGGEPEHFLTTAEVPSHTHVDSGHYHGYNSAAPNATTIGPGAPEPTAIPIPSITGIGAASLDTVGGDGAHNNTQPTMVMAAYIFASWNN